MSSHAPRKVALVGSRIRELRKGRHLTQTELSDKIGIAQSDLSRMEQGEYKVGLDTLFKILQVFDLKMGEFFGETDTPAEKEARDRRPSRGRSTAKGLRARPRVRRGSSRTRRETRTCHSGSLSDRPTMDSPPEPSRPRAQRSEPNSLQPASLPRE